MKKELTILLSIIVTLILMLAIRTVFISTIWFELNRFRVIITILLFIGAGWLSLSFFKEKMAFYICLTTWILYYLYLITFIDGHYYKVGNFIAYSNDNSKTIALYNKWGIKLIPSDYGEIWHYYQLDENNKKGEEKYLAIVGEHLDSIVGKEGFVQYHIYDKDFHLRSRLHFLFAELSSDNSKDRYKELMEKITPEDIIMLTQYHYNHEKGLRWYDYHNWDKINDTIDDSEKTAEEDIKDKPENGNNFFEIGPIDCYSYNDEGNMTPCNAILYVKSFEGEKYYYVSIKGSTEKYSVTKSYDEEGFNGFFSTNNKFYYLNIQPWGSSSRGNREIDNDGQRNSEKSQKIVVEHHRDPQPVQEWVPCTGCNGSGKCFNCNGTGQNLYSTNYMSCVGCGGSGRCEFCAGQGGHYETRFR